MVKEITVQELKALMDEKKDFQLIDVREEFEYEAANMGATLIPLGNIVLEEEKITAYFGAGTLYATPERQEPLL